jgi:exodeoxyribonuclease-3
MKLVSWNVNGLRSVHNKGFLKWLADESADIVCLQEIKISEEQVRGHEDFEHPLRYHSVWHTAQKPGYSGLVIYSKKEPLSVKLGLGNPEFDTEGRWQEAVFKMGASELTVINAYFPNSQREHARLPFKLQFCQAAEQRLLDLEKENKNILICGDFNIAHREIDLKNPKSNQKNAGFLPEERAWLDKMLTQNNWVDTFRHFEPGPNHYTWWSYRPGVREKNIGWRLDYFLTPQEMKDRLQTVQHATHIYGSDHCPVRLALKK